MAIKFLSGLNLSNVDAGSLLKLDSNGNIVAAVANTDYATSSSAVWSTSGSNPTTAYYSGNVRVGTYQASVEASAKLHVFDYQTTTPKLLIEDGNTGDASMEFKISTQSYVMGIDNSDSDVFKFSASSAFDTTNVFTVNTSGNVTFATDVYNAGIIRTRNNNYGVLSTYGSEGFSYEPVESTNTQVRYWLRFDYTNNASYPYLTNRTPNGAVVIKTGTAGGSGENEHFRIKGGDGTVDAYFTNVNLGIGTTSPTSPLHISSSTNKTISLDFSTAGDGTFTWASFQQAGAEKFRVWGGTASGNTYLSFYNTQNSTHQLILASNGDVGIGTTSPSAKLEVADAQADIIINSTTANESSRLRLKTTTREWRIGTHAGQNNGLWFYDASAGQYRMIIDTSGNVGIGTSSPAFKLDVYGASPTTVYESQIRIQSSETTGAQDTGAAISFAGHDGSVARTFGYIRSMKENSTVGDYAGYMSFATRANNSTLAEKMRIKSDGTIQFNSYGAGLLKTNASGVVSLDTNTYLTTTSASSTYLPLTGGTVANGNTAIPLTISRTSATSLQVGIRFLATDGASEPTDQYFGAGTDQEPYWATTANLSVGNMIWHEGNDGASSGLDADLLDGQHGSYYLDYNNFTNTPTISESDTLDSVTDRGATTTNAITVGGLTLGDSHFIGNQTTYDNLLLLSSANENIVLSSAVDLYFNTGGTSAGAVGSNRMFISGTNGNVGIGTTSPLNKLSVISRNNTGYYQTTTPIAVFHGGAPAILVANDANTSGAASELRLGNAHSTYYPYSAYIKGLQGAGIDRYRLEFGTSNGAAASTAMTISQDGNVGIGTTSPGSKLDVAGTWKLAGLQNSAYFSSYDWGTELNISAITSGGWARANRITTSDSSGSVFFGVLGNDTTLTRAYWTVGDVSTINATGYNTNSGIHLLKNSNVGIGTSSPQGPLEVYKSNSGGLGGHIILNNNGLAVGNETAILFNDSGVGSVSSVRAAISSSVEGSPYYGDIKFKTGATSYGSLSTRMIITGGGNVGIGTTSPAQKLDVNGYATIRSGIILDGGATSSYRELIWNTSGYNRWDLYVYGAEPGSNAGGDLFLARYNDAGSYLGNTATFQRSTGNVGIGVTSPSTLLHVNGTITAPGIKTQNAATVLDNSGLQPDQGSTEKTVVFKWSGTEIASLNNEGYFLASGYKTSGTTGYLKSDGTVDTSTFASSSSIANMLETGDELFSINGGSFAQGEEFVFSGLTTAYSNGNWTISGASPTHTHAASDITSGTLDAARIPEWLEEKYIYVSNDSNGVYMPMVKGGMYAASTSSVTGAIKVTLPAYKSNMMFTIYVDIYEYTTGETVTLRVSGYAYNDTGATWHNCSVINLADNSDRDYNVRFYSDTTNSTQYFAIGETNSTWSYPQVMLRDFWGGFNTSESEAKGTWSVEFVTSFTGDLRHTFSGNLVAGDWDNIKDKPTTLAGYGITDGATTSYVDTAVSNLVDSAPTTLNTLNELAAALGDDANFSTTVTTALGNRLRVDANQGLTTDQQSTGRSNLGLGTASTSNSGDFATSSHTHSWSQITSGTRNNYTLGFKPSSNNYAGFHFTKSTSNDGAEDAGYLLVRGTSDSGIYTAEGITLVADAGWLTLAQRTQTDKGIRFMTGSTASTRMVIANGGNVGIGTTTPREKIDVDGNIVTTWGNDRFVGLQYQQGADYRNGLLLHGDNRATGILARGGSGSTPYIWFGGGAGTTSEWARIDKDGKVGIGTNSPTSKLHVVGDTQLTGVTTFTEAGTGSGTRLILSGASQYYNFFVGKQYNVSDTFEITPSTAAGGTTFSTPALVVNSSGKVGIGTTSPTAPLDVPANTSTYKVAKLGNDTTYHYTLTGLSNHGLTLTCGSYFMAEVTITAQQTNDGGYNNLYIRGIWSNNHTNHHWDELENVGYLTGSSFTITNGQNGDTTNSGKLDIQMSYTSGSFSSLVVRVVEMHTASGSHSYTIS